jgi:hypothetical protein
MKLGARFVKIYTMMLSNDATRSPYRGLTTWFNQCKKAVEKVFSAAKVIHNKKKQTFRISPNKEHCFQLNNEPWPISQGFWLNKLTESGYYCSFCQKAWAARNCSTSFAESSKQKAFQITSSVGYSTPCCHFTFEFHLDGNVWKLYSIHLEHFAVKHNDALLKQRLDKNILELQRNPEIYINKLHRKLRLPPTKQPKGLLLDRGSFTVKNITVKQRITGKQTLRNPVFEAAIDLPTDFEYLKTKHFWLNQDVTLVPEELKGKQLLMPDPYAPYAYLDVQFVQYITDPIQIASHLGKDWDVLWNSEDDSKDWQPAVDT